MNRLLALLLALATATPAIYAAGGGRQGFIRCTPFGVILRDGEVLRDRHPIVAALEMAAPGTVIYVEAGNYQPFSIGLDRRSPNNARISGGTAGRPIIVEGSGRVRIKAAGSDTIAIHQRVSNGHITFRNLEIEAGTRAGVMFYKQPQGRVHIGYTFEDCHILGGWDHVRRTGRSSKWGLWAHSLKDFRFVGKRAPARVENIRREHGFYIQNPQGNVTIENVAAKNLGRTFCQFTARAKDGRPGKGTIIVRNCDVRDVGIARGDGYKGGAAFTVAGRLRGTLLFERNRYRAGFDSSVTGLTKKGRSYGTGAFVAWDGGQALRNARLVLRDNDFRFAKGCGDRPVVAIGGCDKVDILGRNVFQSGGQFPALALDPVDTSGNLRGARNGTDYVSPATVLIGELLRRGKPQPFSSSDRVSRGPTKVR